MKSPTQRALDILLVYAVYVANTAKERVEGKTQHRCLLGGLERGRHSLACIACDKCYPRTGACTVWTTGAARVGDGREEKCIRCITRFCTGCRLVSPP